MSPVLRRILSATAAAYGQDMEHVAGRNRHRSLMEPRHVVAYLAYSTTPLTFPAIAREMGRDHSTIFHSYRTIANRIDDGDEKLADRVHAIERALGMTRRDDLPMPFVPMPEPEYDDEPDEWPQATPVPGME